MATLDLGRVIPLERGTWAANTDYVFMDSVQYEGSTYVCIADHTAASGNRPTTSSGQANYWRRNSRGFEPKGAWNANITYDRDNLVDYGGSVYRCIANTTAGTDPTNGTYWESFAQGIGEYLGEWNSNDAYAEGSIVIWDIDSANNINGTFRANQDVPTNYNPGDYPAYWDVLAAGFVWMGTWNNSITYRWRSVVTHHGYLYIASSKAGAPSGEDPTALTNWVKMSEGQNFVGSLESIGSGTSLFVGDVVTFANGTYQVIGNTNGADDPRQTPSNFRSLAKFWDWQGTLNNSTVYYLDQVVIYQNSIYRVLNTTTTGQNPDNASSLFQLIIDAPDNYTDYLSATKRLQIRRVSASTHNSSTYAIGEPVVTLDGNNLPTGELRIHDGSTTGGIYIVPAGAIMSFALSGAPAGWIVCNGSEYSITDFPALYAAISTTWNTAIDPTTGSAHSSPSAGNFRVPDFRGTFLRGIGTASGKDATSLAGYQAERTKLPNTAFGTSQSGNHSHTHYASVNGSGYNMPLFDNRALNQGGFTTAAAGNHTHTISGGDNETRPINFGVLYCIKY